MEIDKAYDVVSLFSTPQRNFLVRNNGVKVKVDSLKGKIVGIFFISLVQEFKFAGQFESRAITTIKRVYDDLSPTNNFQVVLVADVLRDDHDDKELFDILFSRMPWLAIPQDDKESRNKLISILDFKHFPDCSLLDYDKGKILKGRAVHDFNIFGAELYPFTPERRIEIVNDDTTARFSMSIKRLLTTPNRDFLIRNDGKKVPVSDLEGKVVAFYSYTGHDLETVDDLIELYEELQLMGKNFEIVFINAYAIQDERSFMKAFKDMPWLGLPYKDRSNLKLMRIFDSGNGDLVIFSPGEKIPDKYGLDIIREYGIEAYPFTRQRVTEIEVARLKSLSLKSILFSGHCKYIEGNGGRKIKAHHLVNKTVLLLFTRKRCSGCHRLMPKLIPWYNETKERVKEDVEIIHISFDYDPRKNCYYGEMPWLQFPYNEKYNKNLFRKTLDVCRDIPVIIAFGANGRILTRNVQLKFIYKEYESKFEYPFRDVNFFSEVHEDIARKMIWW